MRAIKKLKVMGNGFGMIPVGGSYLVQSVPAELNMDHTVVLQLAEVRSSSRVSYRRCHDSLWPDEPLLIINSSCCPFVRSSTLIFISIKRHFQKCTSLSWSKLTHVALYCRIPSLFFECFIPQNTVKETKTEITFDLNYYYYCVQKLHGSTSCLRGDFWTVIIASRGWFIWGILLLSWE